MKTRTPALAGICLILCIAGLLAIYFLTVSNKYIFLVIPNDLASPKISMDKIDEFCENDFPVTYEIQDSRKVSLMQREFQADVIGTTSAYPQILGYVMTQGSFFSGQAWTGKLRQAVLNEKAAFTIFGSYNIDGSRFRMQNDTWLVTGVINDKDEDHSRIYVPSSVDGTVAPAAFAISKLWGKNGEYGEAYIKNSLKNLGIRDAGFTFHDLGRMCGLFLERIRVILLLFLSFLLLSLLRPLIIGFKSSFSAFKADLEKFYPGEILQKHKKTLLMTVLTALGSILSPVLAILLLIRLAAICLPWQDIPSIDIPDRGSFYLLLGRMQIMNMVSFGIFIVSIAVLCVFFTGINIMLNNAIKFTKTFS